ncbi:protein RodZ, contains Xre-like HTH and DUF4115 domains [Carboxydocella sporoproducens DSM 16521]|uniref:Protein RodZ, contains Xre-like HTH and DUF4115 domains n=2 Tax=Carboxydocella TaxID=178898 RepID=A0A1T4S2K6_9FIRM|nr:protein RodZ [Carboxydocella thermautotrophica]AVX31091.1 protein RodZ [Carboxydocella thermautotrophica]SKA22412.1 protein RodZ, contains Xre-like HTH and DUF4115 domains [Carboxydocella sporoproducens DSM 16521]
MLGGIGEELRQARERMNLTLQKVEEETNMRWRYLEALEKEEWDKIPGEAYVKGFLRNYATYLGLDPDEILLRYKTQRFQNVKIGEEEVIKVHRANIKAERKKEKKIFSKLFVVAVGVLAVILVFYIFNKPQNINISQKHPQIAEKKSESPKQQLPVQQPQQPQEKPSETTQPPPTVEKKKIAITVEIVQETSWLQIETEKGIVWQGIAGKGQKLSFESDKMIKLWVGNAAAVKLKVNGQDLGTMGKKGEVIKKTLYPQ